MNWTSSLENQRHGRAVKSDIRFYEKQCSDNELKPRKLAISAILSGQEYSISPPRSSVNTSQWKEVESIHENPFRVINSDESHLQISEISAYALPGIERFLFRFKYSIFLMTEFF